MYRTEVAVDPLSNLRHIAANVSNNDVSVNRQLGLGRGSALSKQEQVVPTLKTSRILLRSILQVTIISLMFFACNSREIAFRPDWSSIFCWISATVLRQGT